MRSWCMKSFRSLRTSVHAGLKIDLMMDHHHHIERHAYMIAM